MIGRSCIGVRVPSLDGARFGTTGKRAVIITFDGLFGTSTFSFASLSVAQPRYSNRPCPSMFCSLLAATTISQQPSRTPTNALRMNSKIIPSRIIV